MAAFLDASPVTATPTTCGTGPMAAPLVSTIWYCSADGIIAPCTRLGSRSRWKKTTKCGSPTPAAGPLSLRPRHRSGPGLHSPRPPRAPRPEAPYSDGIEFEREALRRVSASRGVGTRRCHRNSRCRRWMGFPDGSGWRAPAPRRAGGSRRCVAASLYRCDNFVWFGEPLFRLFRKHEIAVDHDVELPSGTDDDLGVNTDRVLDGGRQTGGLGQVVSNLAVADRDMHGRDVTAALGWWQSRASPRPGGEAARACILRSACESLGS